MFVYGIRCDVTVIPKLPPTTQADYYMEYGILVLPEFTRPSYVRLRPSDPSSYSLFKRIAENKLVATEVPNLEHPYISESASDAVNIIKNLYLESDTAWFHVPFVHV